MSSSVRRLAFSLEEYARRLTQVQSAMTERGLAALVVHDRAALCYLTSFENCYMTAPYAALVPARAEPVLFASEFEMLNAAATSWCEYRETFRVGDDPLRALAHGIRERGLETASLGVQMNALSAQQYAQLRALLPDAAFQDASTLLPEIMQIKSAEEIAHLREAGRLSTLGMETALHECAAGKTDNDVAAAAYAAMVRGGGEFMCIEPIVTAGNRSGIPHTTFRRTRLAAGDAIFIEVGGCYFRYSAPLMRTAAIAPVADEVRRATGACRASLEALLENMRPGVLAREAAQKARAAWMPLCDELIWHGIYGYSVGLGFPPDWNDAPLLITEKSDYAFEAGMCFHATTSLRRALEFGVACSETVLITQTGHEILTGTPRELHVV
jgi:Xaa-Pro aminopeptidase